MANSRFTQRPAAGNGVERFADFDPATLYEAAGQRGMVDPAIRPAWSGARLCGVAATDAPSGVIVVATVSGHVGAGAWGEILTTAAQARGIAGLAIDGAVRDIDAIREAQFPVFSRGLAIGSCTKVRPGKVGIPIQFGGVIVRPGDIILGAADGMVVLEQERLDDVYETALSRRSRESDIITKLRQGRTTLELLGLVDPRSGEDIEKP
jgi:4-hydroxy-4-methyl-2-oxoglutarate aldolase